MLISGVVFLHDYARSHTAAPTGVLLQHFNWELFDHPPYGPDLAPSDYHLFTHRTGWDHSDSTIMRKEFIEFVKTWLISQAADFFDAGIQELIPRYDKCLNSGDDYVEK
jgi:hypothetical protein